MERLTCVEWTLTPFTMSPPECQSLMYWCSSADFHSNCAWMALALVISVEAEPQVQQFAFGHFGTFSHWSDTVGLLQF